MIKLKKTKKMYPLGLLKNLLSIDSVCELFHLRRKPTTIQMPITSRCNSRCLTCNVWKDHTNIDMDYDKLKEVLQDPFFSNVSAVGINGGELTIVPDFDNIFDTILTLPRLKNLYLISNGLLPNKLLPLLEKCKLKCDKSNIKMNIAISVDGYGEIHEAIRGVPHCFNKTKLILDQLSESPEKYAHSITIGCTLSQKNIAYVHQTEQFLNQYPFYVQYHIAVPNKRIKTFIDYSNYYLLDDEHSRMLAQEYFYEKYLKATWNEKFAFFAQYYFLLNRGHKRLTRCSYKFKDVTIDESLKLYLCATASNAIGDLKNGNIEEVISRGNIRRIEKEVLECCDECIHYVYDKPTWKGFFIYCYYTMKNIFDWGVKFELLAK